MRGQPFKGYLHKSCSGGLKIHNFSPAVLQSPILESLLAQNPETGPEHGNHAHDFNLPENPDFQILAHQKNDGGKSLNPELRRAALTHSPFTRAQDSIAIPASLMRGD